MSMALGPGTYYGMSFEEIKQAEDEAKEKFAAQYKYFIIWPRCQNVYINVSHISARNLTEAFELVGFVDGKRLSLAGIMHTPGPMKGPAHIMRQEYTINWPIILKDKMMQELKDNDMLKLQGGIEEGSQQFDFTRIDKPKKDFEL